MDDKMSAYEAEAKRMHDQYGPGAEIPRTPFGNLLADPGLNVPVHPLPQRIAELAQQTAEAGHMLTEARARFVESARHKEKCEVQFAQVADALRCTIDELREGQK